MGYAKPTFLVTTSILFQTQYGFADIAVKCTMIYSTIQIARNRDISELKQTILNAPIINIIRVEEPRVMDE